MKILFDQGTPVPLRRFLHPHTVDTCSELGWSELQNGALLNQATVARYDVLITTDQNLKYQHTLSAWSIGIIVLRTTSWPRIRTKIYKVVDALTQLTGNKYQEVDF